MQVRQPHSLIDPSANTTTTTSLALLFPPPFFSSIIFLSSFEGCETDNMAAYAHIQNYGWGTEGGALATDFDSLARADSVQVRDQASLEAVWFPRGWCLLTDISKELFFSDSIEFLIPLYKGKKLKLWSRIHVFWRINIQACGHHSQPPIPTTKTHP
ncbi:hypothetical protein DM02DRAFT_244390 [Periconia macrospinosa]|uniref:Uncharacterized protein n=1 Tax=Periconia macrospinosa TaxID=97972 RepID=A0A2V1D5B0_9PLEO|nr:hypothetical protein DM02DRAFT_244390 [Periconia macrospinosa]